MKPYTYAVYLQMLYLLLLLSDHDSRVIRLRPRLEQSTILLVTLPLCNNLRIYLPPNLLSIEIFITC